MEKSKGGVVGGEKEVRDVESAMPGFGEKAEWEDIRA